MATTSFYPLSTKEGLLKEFVGRSIKDVAVPAAVLDLAKTTELTRLQLGEGSGPANIIVSTILEAEPIVRLLLEYKSAGRALLYGFPITQTAVKRLALISKALGPKSLSLMVDHPDQLPNVITLQELSGNVPSIFLKNDIGCHRAGVTPQTSACSTLISSLLELEKAGKLHLLGLYAHAGQSYSSSAASDALDYLRQEFEALLVTAIELRNISPSHPLVLSVGATPTTTSIRNLLHNDSKITGTIPLSPVQTAALALRATIDLIRANECSIEIHAGVYTTLDIQVTTRDTGTPHQRFNAMMTWDDLALTVIAEVASIYPNRGQKNTPEILINAGVIALARETCRVYSGFRILSPWNREGVSPPTTGPETHTGWTVSRISQEHGILTWNGSQANQEIPEAEMLKIGQKIRIWPNHSCIAGAGFGWYLVVDGGDEIVDVWPRWRGW
ncbi:related to alanine racemase [Rhynchosporium secalis]|uniref:Related to alanine racemase n=1 Tax=Rhynchosporium secalis TaxID=38038 RepID=A0A1E1MTH3_RHYSE|nr:related to alanine racemase [Rhynchosporium secalis]